MTAEPIPFTTTRHRCPHCRKSWAHKATAAKHMGLCFADPGRRTCKTCRHDEPPWYDPIADQGDGRHCGLGHDQGPSCVHCGEHPDVCRCPEWGGRQPAKQLRVLCPAWEASA